MALDGLVAFTRALAAAGVDVGTDRTSAYVAAVRAIDVASVRQLYWAGRVTLCTDPDDVARYDAVFAQWYLGRTPPAGEPVVRASVQLAPLTESDDGDGEDSDSEAVARSVGASDAELLRERDIAGLSDAERRELNALFGLMRAQPPTRKSLRLRSARRGSIDPRRTVRAMLGTDEPVRLRRRRRKVRPRRVVLLLDVSGSMEPYADALLRFAHAVVRRTPGAVEVFTAGTRLTRVSRQLRQRDPERALAMASAAVPDYAGGTRLGETLQVFLDGWGHRGFARSAVVVVFSDGWERGEPDLLAEQAARLRRLAHRVLWVNPHAGHEGFAPVQRGMQAVLPHVDRLLAGHSLATLEELLVAMRSNQTGPTSGGEKVMPGA